MCSNSIKKDYLLNRQIITKVKTFKFNSKEIYYIFKRSINGEMSKGKLSASVANFKNTAIKMMEKYVDEFFKGVLEDDYCVVKITDIGFSAGNLDIEYSCYETESECFNRMTNVTKNDIDYKTLNEKQLKFKLSKDIEKLDKEALIQLLKHINE